MRVNHANSLGGKTLFKSLQVTGDAQRLREEQARSGGGAGGAGGLLAELQERARTAGDTAANAARHAANAKVGPGTWPGIGAFKA